MKQMQHPLLTIVSFLILANSPNLHASANAIVDKNKAKTATIEKLIRQHIALGRLKNSFFHPIIANKKSRATRNPFANVPKSLSDALAKQGINLSVISRYKAIYFKGEYLGASSRKIINNSPNTVLVIGKGTRLHDPIFSRGPVVIEADLDGLGGIYGNNIVWLKQPKVTLPTYTTLIGMPVVLNSGKPNIIVASQSDLNKIKQNRQQACKGYATTSVAQYNESRKLGCGFGGSRWNSNWKGQYNWCTTVLDPLTIGEEGFRSDSLKQCTAEKLSTRNPQNRPAIPASCNDPSKQYSAVKQINHAFRYDKKPTSPVQNGLIRYDYNKDKRPDFVFLEAKGENSRAVVCMSRGSNYQRHITDIKIYSSSGLGSYDHQLTQSGATLKIDIQYFEHNAGSSGTQASYQYQTQTGKFKLINSKSDTYGVEQDGYTYPMSSPPTPKLY